MLCETCRLPDIDSSTARDQEIWKWHSESSLQETLTIGFRQMQLTATCCVRLADYQRQTVQRQEARRFGNGILKAGYKRP